MSSPVLSLPLVFDVLVTAGKITKGKCKRSTGNSLIYLFINHTCRSSQHFTVVPVYILHCLFRPDRKDQIAMRIASGGSLSFTVLTVDI
jgi:hypothetical protein